jgi:hypothetical protein
MHDKLGSITLLLIWVQDGWDSWLHEVNELYEFLWELCWCDV